MLIGPAHNVTTRPLHNPQLTDSGPFTHVLFKRLQTHETHIYMKVNITSHPCCRRLINSSDPNSTGPHSSPSEPCQVYRTSPPHSPSVHPRTTSPLQARLYTPPHWNHSLSSEVSQNSTADAVDFSILVLLRGAVCERGGLLLGRRRLWRRGRGILLLLRWWWWW